MHLTGESDGRGLEGVFAVGRARPFLVTARPRRDGRPRSLDVHVSKQVAPRGYGAQLKRQLHRHGIEDRVRVHRHGDARLWRSGSLQELTAPFGADEAILDPTGAIGRARDLVGFATALRDSLGNRLKGVYWEPYRRALFVVFSRTGRVAGDRDAPPDPAGLEAEVRALLRDKAGPSATDYVTAVRLGFAIPRGTFVPIDARSATLGRRETRAASTWWRTPALALALGAALPGTAAAQQYFQATPNQQAPAVSAPNWTYGLEGGSVDSDGSFRARGSYVAPLSFETGYRVDGSLGARDGDLASSFGAHYFRRDPYSHLYGLFGGWATEDPDRGGRAHIFRFAGEAEFYYPNYTIVGAAGLEFSNEHDDGFYGELALEWYPNDDTMLAAGLQHVPSQGGTQGIFKAEFQPGYFAMPGLAFFVEGVAGGSDYSRVLGGMKLYLGSPKSLKDRHRFDTFAVPTGAPTDPDNVSGR